MASHLRLAAAMKILEPRREPTDDPSMRRYGKLVGVAILLTLFAFGVSRYFQMPFASFAALAFLLILTKVSFLAWGRWFTGKDVEAKVAAVLKDLSDDYVVFHDLILPDTKGSTELLLVGSKGLFVIDIEDSSGSVKCDEDRWFLNGHPIRSLSKEAKRNSLAVRSSIATLFTPPGTAIPYVAPVLVFVSPKTKLSLTKPTLPVLRLKELQEFIRNYQPKRILTDYEKRSIVYHLRSLQPGYEDILEPVEQDDKKIA
jgi:hypothetical protein